MTIVYEDLQFISHGKPLRTVRPSEKDLLLPIDIRKPTRHRALLLLHGFSSSPAVYRLLLPHLSQYDAVVCPVLPGHCTNIQDFAQAKSEAWLATAKKTCAELCQEYTAVDVLGLSLGGLIACYLAQQFKLHHLYLLAPATALHLNLRFALNILHTLHALGVSHFRNRGGNLYAYDHYELTYRVLPLTSLIEVFSLIKTCPSLPTKCPVDLFLGKFDAIVNSNAVARQFAHLPNVQMHWLNRSAHVLPLDGDLDTIIKCIQTTF